MRTPCILLISALLGASATSSQQLLVFPAVTDAVPGENGSLWHTAASVIKVDPRADITVRRKWICLPGGGFVDDPASAPTWRLTADPFDRALAVSGEELLVGSASSAGAVALEVEGGEVLAHAQVLDVTLGVLDRWPFGQGQLIQAQRQPLRGPSHIPWLGGCRNNPCTLSADWAEWDYLRSNIGLVNPNGEPLTIRGTVVPLGFAMWLGDNEFPDPEPETFEKRVPAYGWVQFHWVATHVYDLFQSAGVPVIGFVVSLTPDKDLPYYAYGSVVFSPDPDSGVPAFNDPTFIPAEPGYVMPFAEAFPP